MRVLVTGATGFLGKYIITEFARHHCEIIAFGRNAAVGNALPNCTFVQGDFTNYQDIHQAAEGVDVVIHAGALCSVWGKWEDFYNANVLGTQNVLDACLAHSIRKLVYVSSCSIYNCTYDRLDIHEEDYDPRNDLNYYIKTKIMAEELVRSYGEQHALSWSIIRPHGIFGIGDTSVMPRLIKVNQKIGIPLFNQGNNLMDIVCAENVAVSLWLCANSANTGTYNITNGEIVTFRDLVDQVFGQMGLTLKYFAMNFHLAYGITSFIEALYRFLRLSNEPIITKYTLTTVGVSQTLNIDRAREELGYIPQKTLSEGIEAYAQWWRENNQG